ncbi:UNVERIFIED_CONTAM: hypothetical protein HDU68_012133 [Siphonaria sp. JEL0065]|nr:hypothetical protein HDU68_012133 [Siphonaria sp. JEL0065]
MVSEHLGKELPLYQFIVQTLVTNIVHLERLVLLLQGWDCEKPQIAFDHVSKTFTLTRTLAVALEASDSPLKDAAAKVDGVEVLQLEEALVASCDLAIKRKSVVLVAHSCKSLDQKYELFKELRYIAETDFSPSFINANRVTPLSTEQTLLFGIFTYYKDTTSYRRNLLRFAYNIIQHAEARPLDIRFIMGIPKTAAEKRMVLEEQLQFGDIILIDTPEAMNDGKSFHYVRQVVEMMDNGTLPSYKFIAKVDDDMLVNLPAVIADLTTRNFNESTYLGRGVPSNPACFGMMYAFSKTTARKLAALILSLDQIRGNEDQVMGDLVQLTGLKDRVMWNMIDSPDLDMPWSVPVTRNVLGVHQLKETSQMWNILEKYQGLYALGD